MLTIFKKNFLKLKKVDEVSYHLYNVELLNRYKSKEKSKLEIKDLLEQILINKTKKTTKKKKQTQLKLIFFFFFLKKKNVFN